MWSLSLYMPSAEPSDPFPTAQPLEYSGIHQQGKRLRRGSERLGACSRSHSNKCQGLLGNPAPRAGACTLRPSTIFIQYLKPAGWVSLAAQPLPRPLLPQSTPSTDCLMTWGWGGAAEAPSAWPDRPSL